MEKRYRTPNDIAVTNYMDTLVRYVFYKLKKELPNKHDIVYYPAYYMYRENIDEINDLKHLDEGYKLVSATIRKINNKESMIIVKLDPSVYKSDWRYVMLTEVYHKLIDSIDKSISQIGTIPSINKGV